MHLLLVLRLSQGRRPAEGERVQLVGFGSFEVKARAERLGRNPQTGEAVAIPPSKSPVFKAAKSLKDAVNQ